MQYNIYLLFTYIASGCARRITTTDYYLPPAEALRKLNCESKIFLPLPLELKEELFELNWD